MIDAAIFDMDGLMFDTQRLYDQKFVEACAEFGVPANWDMIRGVRGTNGENMYAIIRKYYGDTVDPAALWAECQRLHRLALETYVPKRPGLDELLAWLDAHNVPMAVASSSARNAVMHNLRTAGVDRYFKAVIAGDMVSKSKPDPETFLVAARELGCMPTNTLVLEDAFNGIHAGHAGGFITVMVIDVVEPTDEIRGLANAVCDSLLDVRDMLEAGTL